MNIIAYCLIGIGITIGIVTIVRYWLLSRRGRRDTLFEAFPRADIETVRRVMIIPGQVVGMVGLRVL